MFMETHGDAARRSRVTPGGVWFAVAMLSRLLTLRQKLCQKVSFQPLMVPESDA